MNVNVGIIAQGNDPLGTPDLLSFPQTEWLRTLFAPVGSGEPAACLKLLYKLNDSSASEGVIEDWRLEKNQVETLEIEASLCDEIELALTISTLYLGDVGGEIMFGEFRNGFLPL